MKKKVFTCLIIVGVLFIMTSSAVSASGGKVRGDNGQGPVNQVQEQDPPPFQT